MFDSTWITFLRGALRSPMEVGTLAPSSRHVAREFVRGVEWHESYSILELGPGTGAITDHLHDVMPDPDRYLGIEQDEEYVRLLRDRYPEMHFTPGSAADMVEHLEASPLTSVDLVISGLPFATLPESVRARIYDGLFEILEPGAQFRAIQLAHAHPTPSARRFRRHLDHQLGPHRRSRLVWRNLPPAYILVWER